MNPDTLSAEYQVMVHDRTRARAARDARQAELHARAVARRRKAKRGGKR